MKNLEMLISKNQVYTVYAKNDDMTFIMQDVLGELGEIETHVRGFHFGEPDANSIKEFYGKL